ncbi:type I 3-dehydroquinate dehydratase [Salicibibacter cibi]|uniref:3-dehydroquinate dehydratase n=1 Tax=Salicibibacter cibi TaxID=2743001 RepID=A0A7T6ZEP2_9BACI|nr:type I 3-dehydroquinate dehydratase [Salicibibacter cibi]QQK81716.1 type I 3-dehydroquinate dehydratase [Salicibibacter cibi]
MNKGLQLRTRKGDETVHPKICVPLMGKNREALQDEWKQLKEKTVDLLEWRVDYFENIRDVDLIVDIATEIQRETKRPLLFTKRSEEEGGQAVSLNENEVVQLYEAVIANDAVHGVDIELRQQEKNIHHLIEQARNQKIDVILSYHNFTETPSALLLEEKISEAVVLGADVAKIAVMPQSKMDVLTLLQVTEKMSHTMPIPLISMAMGRNGMISRLAGGLFGSALTFASGAQSSAPGQIPTADVEQVLRILKRNM